MGVRKNVDGGQSRHAKNMQARRRERKETKGKGKEADVFFGATPSSRNAGMYVTYVYDTSYKVRMRYISSSPTPCKIPAARTLCRIFLWS